MISKADYERNVFLNCPFDKEYQALQTAILFAATDCGYRVRCALEVDDGSVVRIDKIVRLIAESRLGIHDISRTELDATNSLPRFNMPFELGLFFGASELGTPRQKNKGCLILDIERYRFQKFLSDIAGQDPRAHAGDPEKVIKIIRDWLSANSAWRIPGGKSMVKRYKRFRSDLPTLCERYEIEMEELTFNDWTDFITEWVMTDTKI